jgi:leader peptidase (prepilin peptidase)/N-methyltransferase
MSMLCLADGQDVLYPSSPYTCYSTPAGCERVWRMVCAILTLFLAALGACIGSFLNVVIYRLPRGLSVRRPARSFCPSCQQQIKWYDNIPIASWIALKGRCRNCGLPISLQYPLVEAACVVLTMLVWHAVRTGVAGQPADESWPVLLGMLGLFWCLLGLSAMDLQEYYVDIRLTWFALAIGLICHAIGPARPWPAEQYATAPWVAFAVGCTAALVLVHWLWPMADEEVIGHEAGPAGAAGPPPADDFALSQQAPSAANDSFGARSGSVGSVVLLAIITVAVIGLEAAACPLRADAWPGRLLIVTGLGTLFGAILAASWLPTEADEAIAQAVEAERSTAVRQAAREVVVLAIVFLAGLGLMWLSRRPAVSRLWLSAYGWTASDQWQPVAGLGAALLGWVVAGGTCWLVRVLFTMVLRKEALGFGDIHIMAAAGAVMGPRLGIAGFFLAAPVALLGTLVLVFRKRYRTLPFGPWLSLGFLLALLWCVPLIKHINNVLEALDLLLSGGARRPLF